MEPEVQELLQRFFDAAKHSAEVSVYRQKKSPKQRERQEMPHSIDPRHPGREMFWVNCERSQWSRNELRIFRSARIWWTFLAMIRETASPAEQAVLDKHLDWTYSVGCFIEADKETRRETLGCHRSWTTMSHFMVREFMAIWS